MNINETAILPKEQNWKGIYADVNAWRGACLHSLSTVELSVTETLFALDKTKPKDTSIRLRHLVGQRYEDLAAVLNSSGRFGDEGDRAFLALSQYREKHETFRSQLCHGVVKVSIDQAGTWVLVIRTLAIRSRQEDRKVLVLDQAEAAEKLATLKRDGQILTSALGQLRRTLSAT